MVDINPQLAEELMCIGVTDPGRAPDTQTWRALLNRVGQSYVEAENARRLLESSLQRSSAAVVELSSRLRADADRLATIAHALGDGLCALDPEGRLLFMNPEAELVLGWREEEMIGQDLLTRVVVSDGSLEEQAPLRALIGHGEAYRNEHGLFLRKDGSPLPVCYTLSPLAVDGAFSGAVLLFRDITPLQQRLAAQAQVVLFRQEIEVQQERERALHNLTRSLMQAREDARRNIALELHDEVLQPTTVFVRQLHGSDEPMAEWLRDLLITVRHLCDRLRPRRLDDFGLVPGISALVDHLRARFDCTIVLVVDTTDAQGTGRLGEALEVALFRVAEEVLEHELSHVGSGEVELTVGYDGEHVQLRVVGRGGAHAGLPACLGVELGVILERLSPWDGVVTSTPSSAGHSCITARVTAAAEA